MTEMINADDIVFYVLLCSSVLTCAISELSTTLFDLKDFRQVSNSVASGFL